MASWRQGQIPGRCSCVFAPTFTATTTVLGCCLKLEPPGWQGTREGRSTHQHQCCQLTWMPQLLLPHSSCRLQGAAAWAAELTKDRFLLPTPAPGQRGWKEEPAHFCCCPQLRPAPHAAAPCNLRRSGVVLGIPQAHVSHA